MIRFSCPGCEAVFNVSDDKAGKTGKCPKCSSQFTIPAAPDAPPLPPAPAAANGASVEIAPCPKCGARLSVEAGDIGLEVECPTCRAVYPAEPAVTAKRRDTGSGQTKSLAVRERGPEEVERPSRRRREVARDDDEEDERPSRRGRRDDDDEDERPRKKKRRGRAADLESKRMPTALLAFFLGSFGAHKFYLGYTTPGLVMLLGSLFGYVGGCLGVFCFFISFPLFLIPTGMGLVSFIEFIIYLSRDDENFIDTYQVNRQEWF